MTYPLKISAPFLNHYEDLARSGYRFRLLDYPAYPILPAWDGQIISIQKIRQLCHRFDALANYLDFLMQEARQNIMYPIPTLRDQDLLICCMCLNQYDEASYAKFMQTENLATTSDLLALQYILQHIQSIHRNARP